MGKGIIRLARTVALGSVSAIAVSAAATTVAVAQSSSLPAITVDAPKPRATVQRAAPTRRATGTRAPVRRATAAPLQRQVPVAYVTPSTGTIGAPPAPYAGGQVASGGRVGFLGNRSIFDTPFTQNNYTEQLIRDQQALTVLNVIDNNPAARPVASPYSPQPNIFIRGFEVNAREFAFDGLYGIAGHYRPALEGIERIEVLNGPGALLYGFPPEGNVGGIVNLIPKRATDAPITRITGQYLSDATFGAAVDLARRFGEANEWGVRFNGAYREGATPIDRNTEKSGTATLGLDYRGERLRLSADFGYEQLDGRALIQSFNVLPGFVIPRAPSLTSNVQFPWERFETKHLHAVGRAEYDLARNVTWFGAIGGSKTANDMLSTRPQITSSDGGLRQNSNLYVEEYAVATAETGVRTRFATGFIEHNAAVVGTHFEREQPFVFQFGQVFLTNLYAPTNVPQPFFPPAGSLPRTIPSSQLDGIAITDAMSMLDGRVQVIAGGRFQRAQTRSVAPTGVITGYDESAATPLGSVLVKPLQNLSLYASYAEGFGFGPTAPAGSANVGAVFPPVITKQKEVGAKLDLGTIGASLALFEITRPSGFTDPITLIFGLNGEQRNRGIDVNVFGEPTPGLRVLGGVTFLDGVLSKTLGGTFDGNKAQGAPDVQVNIGGEVDLPWLSGFTVNGRVIYTGRQFYNQANTQSIPDYARLDFGARYSFVANGTPMVARFNVLNVTGNDYWASTGQGFLSLGTPRTFLLSMSADLIPAPIPAASPRYVK